MIGFHVVDNQIVDSLPVLHHFLDLVEELREESSFNRIDQRNLFIINQIGIVADALWQWPNRLEQMGFESKG